MPVLAVVPCGKLKLTHPAPAKDMYIGTFFKAVYRFALKHSNRIVIVSAKYGVLEPDQTISPYDVTLSKVSKEYRREWSEKVAPTLQEFVDKGYTLLYLCNKRYREGCPAGLTPLEGKGGMGEQIKWLKEHT